MIRKIFRWFGYELVDRNYIARVITQNCCRPIVIHTRPNDCIEKINGKVQITSKTSIYFKGEDPNMGIIRTYNKFGPKKIDQILVEDIITSYGVSILPKDE